MLTSRRSFLCGLGAALIAAPAVIRTPGLLMPIRALTPVQVAPPVTIPVMSGMAAPGISKVYFDGHIIVPRGNVMREAVSLKIANPTDAPLVWTLMAKRPSPEAHYDLSVETGDKMVSLLEYLEWPA